jgi:hypothetical protein
MSTTPATRGWLAMRFGFPIGSLGMMGDACMSKSCRVSAFGGSHPTLRTGHETRPAFKVSLGPQWVIQAHVP